MRSIWALAAAGAASVASAAVAQTSAQQDYDAASALDNAGDHAGGALAWQRFGKRPGLTKRSVAIAKVREGADLVALGKLEEGAVVTREGLADLPASDASLAYDRWRANLNLGRAAELALDYPSAANSYAAAETGALDLPARVSALVGLTRVTTFIDPAAAKAALVRLDEAATSAKLVREDSAQVARIRGLVALNTGDLPTARASAIDAVAKLGGITEKTSVDDARARSDAAIALLLSNKPDEARRYMAMSGAGRLGKGAFDPAVQMQAPDCGGEAALQPSDVAVVEFAVDDQGRTTGVRPIYAAGGPKAGIAFAKAVRDWSWTPEQMAGIPRFFRYTARVEMRCSTAFERPSISDMLTGSLDAWLAGKGVQASEAPRVGDAVALSGQRTALAAAEARAPDSLETLSLLYQLGTNRAISDEERAKLYGRALAIARGRGAPPTAQLALDLDVRTAVDLDSWKPRRFEALVAPMLIDPVYARDVQARAALRLLVADRLDAGKTQDAMTERATLLLRQVADDPGLAANDPLRVGALVRLASIEQRAGNAAAARAAFEKSGLDASQCSLLDASPKMTSLPGSEAFPKEAMMWGFEGWTQVQYDVDAAGRATSARTLVSYPPFIFSKAGKDVFGHATFSKTYRPDGGLGCGALTTRVKFLLPDNAPK